MEAHEGHRTLRPKRRRRDLRRLPPRQDHPRPLRGRILQKDSRLRRQMQVHRRVVYSGDEAAHADPERHRLLHAQLEGPAVPEGPERQHAVLQRPRYRKIAEVLPQHLAGVQAQQVLRYVHDAPCAALGRPDQEVRGFGRRH